jgi:hypothetical protein
MTDDPHDRTQKADVGDAVDTQDRKAGIDFNQLNADLSTALSSGIERAPLLAGPPSLLDELVEDMMHVLQRLQAIEEGIGRLQGRIEQLGARSDETGRAIAGELSSQRRDLLGERKGVLARGLFNAVVGHIDALRAMRQGLYDPKGNLEKNNRRTADHLDAIEITLLTALQGMGFNEFHAKVGDPFSPSSMECLGYARGERGVVLRVVRSGFVASEGVVRPAGVYIAEPVKSPDVGRVSTDKP